jgi:hypothetical protein
MSGKGGDEEGLVEHRFGRTGQDDRRVGNPEKDGPAPPSVTDDVEDRQQHPWDGDETLRHVHVVDLTQNGSGKRDRWRRRARTPQSRGLQRAKEDVHPDGDGGRTTMTSVATQAARSGRMTNSPVRG